LVEAVDDPPDALPPPPSSAVTQVEVCAYSGHLPSEACPETERALLPTRHVPTEQCPFHTRAAVDEETGRVLDPSCRDSRDWEYRTFVVWTSGVQRWMTDRGASVPRMPEYADGCRPPASRHPPEIVSPPRDADLVLVPGLPADDQQVPLAADADSNAELHWFVDGSFVGAASSDRRIWWTPQEGTHELKVMDGHGATASRKFTVR
jgi:penicillin-binding protein 1C